jgi:hypothetical protein
MCASGFCFVLMMTLCVTSIAVPAPARSCQDVRQGQSDREVWFRAARKEDLVLRAAPPRSGSPRWYLPQRPDNRGRSYSSALTPAADDNFSDDLRRRIEDAHGHPNVDEGYPRRMTGQVLSGEASPRPRGPVLHHRRWVDRRP